MRTALFAIAAVILGVSAANAVEAPDSLTRARLQSRIDAAGQVNVTTRKAMFLTSRLQLEADAIFIPTERRTALIEMGDVPPTGRRIAWSEVERLDIEHSNLQTPTLVGAAVGAVLGGALLARKGTDGFEEGDHFMLAVATGTFLLGTGIGFLIGLASPHVEPLYP